MQLAVVTNYERNWMCQEAYSRYLNDIRGPHEVDLVVQCLAIKCGHMSTSKGTIKLAVGFDDQLNHCISK